MGRVIHFEIHTSDPERAAAFYSGVFGWKIDEWKIPGVKMKEENRYWNVNTGPDSEPGINGGMVIRNRKDLLSSQPSNAFVCTVGVEDLDMSIQKAIALGGSLAQSRMPVMGIGWLAYCVDTEGNTFGMLQADKNAR
jgi:predicted enzyme related to lactoylglutathione lyase